MHGYTTARDCTRHPFPHELLYDATLCYSPKDYCMSFANVSANNTRAAFAPLGYDPVKSPTGNPMMDAMLVTLSQVIVEVRLI
jgi:hypothetical protein